MRYSLSALVLATASISQVAAGPTRHAHQHFHEKKHTEIIADSKVVEREAVNWEEALKNVDWSKAVDWSKVNYGGSGSVPPPAVTAAVQVAAPAATTASVAVQAPQSTKAAAVVSNVDSAISGLISTTLSTVAHSNILSMGFAGVGHNAKSQASSQGIWIGTDGAYTNEFTNDSGMSIILSCWGSAGSWVNAIVPLITVSLDPGAKTTLSFANGHSGSCAAVYPDTQLINGQISNTWLEHTYSPSGVVDVSREVNMNGHGIKSVGPTCTTDMDTCVFKCDSGSVCTTGYSLHNCSNGSQQGATFGRFENTDSGGCGWNGASSASLKTSLF